MDGYGGYAYPHFLEWGYCTPLFTIAVGRLQRCPDSLARFVGEERVKIGAEGRKWGKQRRGKQIWYPHILAQSDTNAFSINEKISG